MKKIEMILYHITVIASLGMGAITAAIDMTGIGADEIVRAESTVPDAGLLTDLLGTWQNVDTYGMNSVAVPFHKSYRLMVNKYIETIDFHFVDGNVPNRGPKFDQFVATIEYNQSVSQILAAQKAPSPLEPDEQLLGKPNSGIHHEVGLFLNMKNGATDGMNIARMSTVPHGQSVLALGSVTTSNEKPQIDEEASAIPVHSTTDLNDNYLLPYKHFHDQPFDGTFDALYPNKYLASEIDKYLAKGNKKMEVIKTTAYDLDTTRLSGGVSNIPFQVAEANAVALRSIFWVIELQDEEGEEDNTTDSSHVQTKKLLAYSQFVDVDFLYAPNLPEGKKIMWPHVSVNLMQKI